MRRDVNRTFPYERCEQQHLLYRIFFYIRPPSMAIIARRSIPASPGVAAEAMDHQGLSFVYMRRKKGI